MCELIHRADFRLPGKNGGCIHLFEFTTAVFNAPPRENLQSFCLRDRILPSVRLEVTNDDVMAFPLQSTAFVQHLVRLADAGSISEEYLRLTLLPA